MDCNCKGKMRIGGKLQVVILFLFFFSIAPKSFAQSASERALTEDVSMEQTTTRQVGQRTSSNFILWFMGTKDNMGGSQEGERFYTKKSIMTSGAVPNRLLLKTLLKKTINSQSC